MWFATTATAANEKAGCASHESHHDGLGIGIFIGVIDGKLALGSLVVKFSFQVITERHPNVDLAGRTPP